MQAASLASDKIPILLIAKLERGVLLAARQKPEILHQQTQTN
jgi:hypothetical protein